MERRSLTGLNYRLSLVVVRGTWGPWVLAVGLGQVQRQWLFTLKAEAQTEMAEPITTWNPPYRYTEDRLNDAFEKRPHGQSWKAHGIVLVLLMDHT